ncbi:MAG: hypothetical protein HY962_17885 [Ignavibacteriae bacterium]|nr:hypothetical protein [Ignavibacteriota bacterium]
MKLVALCTLVVVLSCPALHAQESGGSAAERKSADSGYTMTKSPMGAVLRSALLPGLGQWYNESYWKVPVVVGLGVFLIRGVVVENNGFLDYRDRYAASITPENSSGDLRLKQLREVYRDNRDTYAWWFLVLYLVQCADAFVDAHLYDFDVSETLSATVLPAPRGVMLQLRF